MHQASHIFFLSDPFALHGEEQDKKALFLKNFLINNQIKAPITLQFALYDEQYLLNFEKDYYREFEQFIKDNEIFGNPDYSLDYENMQSSLISKFENKHYLDKFNKSVKEVNNYKVEAIGFIKLKLKLLAQNTLRPGSIPLGACFLIDNPIPVTTEENTMHDKLCKVYYESLKYQIIISEIPYM